VAAAPSQGKEELPKRRGTERPAPSWRGGRRNPEQILIDDRVKRTQKKFGGGRKGGKMAVGDLRKGKDTSVIGVGIEDVRDCYSFFRRKT